MKVYLLSAAGVIFLSVIVSLLVPEGKLHKSVTFVMRLICILVLIQPVTGIFKIGGDAPAGSFYDYEYICNIYSDNQSTELEKLLVKEFGADTDCTVSVEHQDGQFKVTGVSVEVNGGNNKIIEEIYAYLDGLKYINITVYAKSY